MQRADRLLAALATALLLAACAGTPPAPEAPARRHALEVEHDGAKRYARGDFVVAAARFQEASRLFIAIDDDNATARNRLHQARALLAGNDATTAAALSATLHDHAAQGLDARLLSALAALQAGDGAAADRALEAAAIRCAGTCLQRPTLALLQARRALATQRPGDALAFAGQAQALLKSPHDDIELANAARLAAEAQLALGDKAAAHRAAQAALELDRRLALPEKIARDWLLLARSSSGDDARHANRQAARIAAAAGLRDIEALAQQALPLETSP